MPRQLIRLIAVLLIPVLSADSMVHAGGATRGKQAGAMVPADPTPAAATDRDACSHQALALAPGMAGHRPHLLPIIVALYENGARRQVNIDDHSLLHDPIIPLAESRVEWPPVSAFIPMAGGVIMTMLPALTLLVLKPRWVVGKWSLVATGVIWAIWQMSDILHLWSRGLPAAGLSAFGKYAVNPRIKNEPFRVRTARYLRIVHFASRRVYRRVARRDPNSARFFEHLIGMVESFVLAPLVAFPLVLLGIFLPAPHDAGDLYLDLVADDRARRSA